MAEDIEVVVLEKGEDELPEFQYELVEWKTPDRKELLYQSESFDDLVEACNFMHHTLHKQKGYVEIRRIENKVIRIKDGDMENMADEIFLALEKIASTTH